jgi:cytochrome c556
MRRVPVILIAVLAVVVLVGQTPSPFQPVGNMSQLMIDVIYPTSDAIFYVERNPPKNDQEWGVLRANALTLAESGNLLMMGSRARDQDGWIKDAKLLVDAGAAAFKAARAKDLNAVVAVNDQLYTACVTCHQEYRPNYRRRLPVKQ